MSNATAAMFDGFSARLRSVRWPRILKVLLVVVVLAAVGRYLWRLWLDWEAQAERFSIAWRPLPLVLCGLFYLLGMSLFGVFWRALLVSAGIRVPPMELLRAYFLGAMGKYVPGKAFVLVLRTGMLQRHHARRLPIVLSIFYETLAMMAVGAGVGFVALAVERRPGWWWPVSLAVALGLGSILHPAFFGPAARIFSKPFTESVETASIQMWFGVMVRRLYLPVAAWMSLGLSGAAAVAGIGLPAGSVDDFLLITGSVAVGSAAGFVVVFMPSGIGVREFVIVTLLAPRYGAGAAVAVSLVLRTIWTVGDLAAAGMAYPWRTRRGDPVVE